MSLLFTPFQQRSLTLRNRIVVSPMCQYSATDGLANDWHLVHLGSRAVGGAGLVMMEATAVVPEGRITPGCLGLWSDEHVPMLQRITAFIRAQGAAAGIQLAHAGRKASHQRPWEGGKLIPPAAPGGWPTVAPSAIAFAQGNPSPAALTPDAIAALPEAWESASKRALKAGFQVAEIHAAHGYLLHQFMSPLTNHRTDAYGGSFENRTRLLCDIVESVRSVWPADLPVWVRISATDWVEGGWTIDDSVALAEILQTMGVDLIDCSSGGNSPLQRIPTMPGYQVPFAAVIRRKTGMPTGAVGLITQAEEAENILQAGKADVILMARQLLRDPYFPLQAASTLGVALEWPNQYLRAK